MIFMIKMKFKACTIISQIYERKNILITTINALYRLTSQRFRGKALLDGGDRFINCVNEYLK